MEDFYTVDKLVENGIIPEEYSIHIKKKCDVCGSSIVRNEALTKTKCSNSVCPGHKCYVADELVKRFTRLKGFGPESAKGYLIANPKATPFDWLTMVNFGKKPDAYLYEIVKYVGIPGIDETAEKIFSGYRDIDDYLKNARSIPSLVRAYAPVIRRAQEHFYLLTPLSRDSVSIMITGSISGYGNREQFVTQINNACGQVIRTVLKKSPNQGVDFLLADDAENIKANAAKGIMNLKTAAAIKGGVRIVTPLEYVHILTSYIQKKNLK